MSSQSDTRACTCGAVPGAAQGSGGTQEGAEQRAVPRTAESERAESALETWRAKPPSERPLWMHRGRIADALGVVLKRHDVSKNRFAAMLDVNKKVVRRMLACEQPIHLDVLMVLPAEMAVDVVDRLFDGRGVQDVLRRLIDRLDRKELVDVIGRATARLAEGK